MWRTGCSEHGDATLMEQSGVAAHGDSGPASGRGQDDSDDGL